MSRRLVGYIIASVGGNHSDGYIPPVCSHPYTPCEHASVTVNTQGTLSGMAGLGVRLPLFDAGGLWRWYFPQRLYAEARIANQATADGRMTMTPLQIGASW